MRWDTLHEAVRCAVAHRYDWPLPIAIVADWDETGRAPGPGRYCACPAGSPETDVRAAVFSLEPDDLLILAPLLDDFALLDQALEMLLHQPDNAGANRVPDAPPPSPLTSR